MKRFLAICLTCALLLGLLPTSVLAASVTTSTYAGLTVTGTSAFETSDTGTYRTLTIQSGGTYTLTGSKVVTGEVGVVVNAPNQSVTLTLDNLTAQNDDVDIADNISFIKIVDGNVSINLVGTNSIYTPASKPPIHIAGGGVYLGLNDNAFSTGSLSLTCDKGPGILHESDDLLYIGGRGTITVKTYNNDAAAIETETGDISIYGTVVAESRDGAAIGSGNGKPMNANIRIYGEVTAKGGSGAAVGSGKGGTCGGEITIGSDSRLDVESHTGAAIGSGESGDFVGTIDIDSGEVIATNTFTGAGIGSGQGGSCKGNIAISDSAVSISVPDIRGAAIGSGYGGRCESTITINDSTVTTDGKYGIGVGGGRIDSNENPCNITIANSTVDTGRISTGSFDGSGLEVSGNSLVRADSIVTENPEYKNSIVFAGAEGTVYGKVTLEQNLTLEAGQTLTIPEDASLTVSQGHTLTVPEDATLEVGGTLEGTPSGGGQIKHSSTVSVVFKKDGAEITQAVYSDQITIYAQVTRESSGSDYTGTVDFYLANSMAGVKLGNTDVTNGQSKGIAELAVQINSKWAKSQTVTAVFSGNAELLPGQKTSNPLSISGIAMDGDGSEAHPYQISTAQQLAYFSTLVNQGQRSLCAELMADIALPDTNWTPIGNTAKGSFTGTFDGKGHTISGLKLEDVDIVYRGLFGWNSGTVRDIKVSGEVRGQYGRLGGIAGWNTGTISGCESSVTIEATPYGSNMGGIAGYNDRGTIIDCINRGAIQGKGSSTRMGNVGGIVGLGANGESLYNCQNFGAVSYEGYNVGGVAGKFDGNVIKCGNMGAVSGTDENVGGVIGAWWAGTVLIDCWNTGTVSGRLRVGGVVGYDYGTTVSNCLNTGTVSGSDNVGAVVGSYFGSAVENCYFEEGSCIVGIGGGQINDGTAKSESKTADQLASGEVAALLQAGREETVWGQDLSGDETAPKLTDKDSERVIIVTVDGETSYLQSGSDCPTPPGNGYWVDENGVPLDTETSKLTDDVTFTSSTATQIILSNTTPTVTGHYGENLTLTFAQYIKNIDEIGGVKSCALISGELPDGLTVDGNTISGTPAAAGQTTVKIVVKGTNEAGAYLTVTFDVEGAASMLDGLKVYKDTEETTVFTYGDTVTVKFTPQPSNANIFSLSAPSSNQAALFLGDTQLTEPVAATEGTECTITYDTIGKGLQIGSNTLTVRYGGGGNLSASAGEVTVTIQAKALTVIGLMATGRVYDGSTTVALTGGTLTGLLNGDSVTLDTLGSGTLADANAGAGKAVTLPTLSLTGKHAAYYTVTPPADVTVTITKKPLTDNMIAPIDDQTYTGNTITPTLTVTDGNPSIIKASDYTASYSDNTNAGTATASITAAESGNYQGSAHATFQIVAGGSQLAGLKTYNRTTEATTFTYGDTITVKFTPKASGATYALTARGSNQAALFVGDTQLTEPVAATEGTECSISYDTAGKGLQIGRNTLTVRYGGGGNLSASAGEVTVTLEAKALTVTGIAAANRAYDGTATVALTGGTLAGVLNGDSVTLDTLGSGTLADANAGAGKAVTLPTLSLTGEHAAYYTVTPPAGVTVEITRKPLTDNMIAPIDSQVYTGNPITPALTVTDGNPSIIKASDYTVGYSDNVIVGEATATVAAADNGNYQGSASRTFRIRPGITGDVTHTGLDVSQNPPISEMLYKAGTGTVSYVPGSPAVVTLENATISPAAASGLKLGEAQVVLIGENKIVNPSGYWGIEATGNVEITGDGILALTGGAPILAPEAGIEITSGTVSVEGLITAKKLVTANLGRLSIILNDSDAEPFSQCEESGYQIGSVTVIYTAGSKTYQEPLNIADLWWNETRPGYCWEFTVDENLPTGGILTLDGITVDASGCENDTPAIILPGGDVEVKLSGSNTVKGTGRTAISSVASDVDDTITLSGPGSLQTNGAVTAQEGFIGSLPLPILTIKYSETPKLLTEPLNFATTWWTETGPGYSYDPASQTLALQGLTLETEQWVGIAVAPDTTVILTGENSISSGTVAIDCAEGGMVLKGNGSLNAKVKNAAIVGEEGGLTVSGDLTIESTARYVTVSCGKMEINGALRLKLTDAERGLTALLCEGDNVLILASGYQIEGGKQIVSYAPDDGDPDMYTVIGTRDAEGNVVLATEVVITKKSTGGSGNAPISSKPSVAIGGNGEGGKVTASRDGTVTIIPDEGYEIVKITVNGKEVEIPEDGKLTGLKRTDKVVVTFGEIPAPVPVSQRFTDVKAGVWYEDAVQFAVDNGLFNGTSDTTFAPESTMTRGVLATVLYRLAQEPEITTEDLFNDVVSGQYYTQGIAWAAGKGIVNGYGNGSFGPNDPITREQLATMLWRYAGSPNSAGNLDSFTDGVKTSKYAVPALQWAVEQGIVNGKGSGILDPQGQATRAEVATLLMRYLQAVKK